MSVCEDKKQAGNIGILAGAMTESDLQQNVVDLAHACGWLVHHTRPAMKRDGTWRTPVQGDKGFPDLVLARRGKIIFLELKSQRGQPTNEQLEWLNRLAPHTGLDLPVVGLVVRPSDWLNGTIEEALS